MSFVMPPSVVELVSGRTSEGKCFYAYISIEPEKYLQFKEEWSTGQTMDLTFFGEIIETGWGKRPAPETVRRMAQEHNFHDDFPERLQNHMNETAGHAS